MRTIFIASVRIATAVTCVGMAAAKDLTLTRNAESGVDSRIAYERAWDRDCKALPTTVTVTQPPKNGALSVVQGTSTIPASTPNSGSTENCAGKTVTGSEVHYKAKAGSQFVEFGQLPKCIPIGFDGNGTPCRMAMGGNICDHFAAIERRAEPSGGNDEAIFRCAFDVGPQWPCRAFARSVAHFCKCRGKTPRRQGGAVRLVVHAARHRHADRHFCQARPRHRGIGVGR